MLDLPPDTVSSGNRTPVPREVLTVLAPRVQLANSAISNAELLPEEARLAAVRTVLYGFLDDYLRRRATAPE